MLLEDPNPYIFQIGEFGLRWYGFTVALSMALGIWYLLRQSRRRGWDEDAILMAATASLLMGVVGARLVFVLTNWSYFADNWLLIFRGDGLSWHGALLGGILTGWLLIRRQGYDFMAILDVVVPGLNIGYILVRLANILNQEVLGRYAEILATRHPAQLYGSAIGLVLLIRYFYLQRYEPPNGYQFWSWVFWYSVLRGVIEETVRANPLYAWHYINDVWGVGFFTLTQIITPVILLVSGYFMLQKMRGKWGNARASGKKGG